MTTTALRHQATTPDDEEILRKPVIIMGAPRCGTTLLWQLLREHPAFGLGVGESPITWRWGNERKSDMLRPEDARPRVVHHIRRKFAATIRRRGGGRRMLEKTPANSLRPAFVDRIFPDCRMVHILRHGVESALAIREFWLNHEATISARRIGHRLHELSLRQTPRYALHFVRRLIPRALRPSNIWGPRLPGIEAMLRDMDLLDVCCLQWRMCVETTCLYGRRHMPPDRYLECRIEDMSVELLRRVCEFCELDLSDAMCRFFKDHFDSGQIDHRRRAAHPADVERATQQLEPTLRWLGYV